MLIVILHILHCIETNAVKSNYKTFLHGVFDLYSKSITFLCYIIFTLPEVCMDLQHFQNVKTTLNRALQIIANRIGPKFCTRRFIAMLGEI